MGGRVPPNTRKHLPLREGKKKAGLLGGYKGPREKKVLGSPALLCGIVLSRRATPSAPPLGGVGNAHYAVAVSVQEAEDAVHLVV